MHSKHKKQTLNIVDFHLERFSPIKFNDYFFFYFCNFNIRKSRNYCQVLNSKKNEVDLVPGHSRWGDLFYREFIFNIIW